MTTNLQIVNIDDLDNAIAQLRPETLAAAVHATNAANDLALEFDDLLRYFASDRGAAVSPRYAVVRRPQIGDKVSRTFNGDYRPEGEITSMTGTMSRIMTSTGVVFTRRKPYQASVQNSAVWMVKGSDSITMVRGHITRRNEEF